jgi:hypothetical protein
MSNKLKRTLASGSFLTTTVGVPLGIFSVRYELWQFEDSRKLGLFTLLILGMTLIGFRKFISTRIKAMNHGALKTTLVSVGALVPTSILYGIGWFIAQYATLFLDVLNVFAVTQVIGWTAIYPFVMHYDYATQRDIRKKEMIDAIKAAGESKHDNETLL